MGFGVHGGSGQPAAAPTASPFAFGKLSMFKSVEATAGSTTATTTIATATPANANAVAVTTTTVLGVAIVPTTKGKTAAEYVLELKLDDHNDADDDDGDDDGGMLEEVLEEMEKASAAWRKVMGGTATTNSTATLNCSASSSHSSSSSSSSVLCALVEALGTTYDEERHGGALRRTAIAHATTTTITTTAVTSAATDKTTTGSDGGDVACELTEELFVDWYVRMLYADDQDDGDDELPVCTGDGPGHPSTPTPANSALTLAAAGGGSVDDAWKCGVCLVSNKDKGQAKCACCDAPNPSHNSTAAAAVAGIVTPAGSPATTAVATTGNTSFSFGGSVDDAWKCGVCLVSNKDKGQAKCACCDAPNPSHNSTAAAAVAGIVTPAGSPATTAVATTGNTSFSVGGVVTTPPAGGTVQSSITDKGFTFGITNATTTSTGMSSIGATGFVFRPAAAASTPPQSASFGLTTPSTSADPARSLFGLSLAAPVTQTVTTATASAPLAFGSSVPPTASAAAPTASPYFVFGKLSMFKSVEATTTTAGSTTTTTTPSPAVAPTFTGFGSQTGFGTPGAAPAVASTPSGLGMFGTTPAVASTPSGLGMFGTTPAVVSTPTGFFGASSSSSPQPPVTANTPSSMFGTTKPTNSGGGVVPSSSQNIGLVSSAFKLQEFLGFGSSTPVVTVTLSSAHLAFQIAVTAENLDKVQEVHADVGKDIDVNFKDPNNGRTFLHWAAFYGHASVAIFLIELGANKDIEGLGGATPLHLAAQEGRVEIVTLLLAKGVDMDKVNAAGATALCLAARQGHLSVMKVWPMIDVPPFPSSFFIYPLTKIITPRSNSVFWITEWRKIRPICCLATLLSISRQNEVIWMWSPV